MILEGFVGGATVETREKGGGLRRVPTDRFMALPGVLVELLQNFPLRRKTRNGATFATIYDGGKK